MALGETSLQNLLKHMSPELLDDEFVFISVDNARYGDLTELEPIAAFLEREGLTLIITKQKADRYKKEYQSVFSCITLKIHSSLDAVGLTAAFSGKLAEHGISANVVAGYYHDHIFVQSDCATRAIQALNELIQSV